jgi:electron transfer flavoprotein alpha/beta subunit
MVAGGFDQVPRALARGLNVQLAAAVSAVRAVGHALTISTRRLVEMREVLGYTDA